jgi:hypothetical protein
LFQGSAIEQLPIRLRRKGFEVQIAASIQGRTGRSDDAAEIAQSFFIDLIVLQELRIVAEVPEKPIEFPQGPFGAVDSTGDLPILERLGFQYMEMDFQEWLLRMPVVASTIHANEE